MMYPWIRIIHQRNRMESGNSILSVIIGMALLLSAVSAAMLGMKNIGDNRKILAASAATKDVENAIVAAVSESFKNFVQNRCTVPGDVGPQIQMGSFATLDYSTVGSLAGAFSSPKTKSDFDRCNSKEFAVSAGRYYECYQLTIGSGFKSRSSKESFAANKGAFVEVLVNIKDLRTDSYVSCETIPPDATGLKIDTSKGASGYGLEIYYSLNWVMKTNKEITTKNRVGAVNVGL